MAFRDTSERYEYIYGSNVKKLDRETAGSTKSGSTKRAGNTARKSEYAVERSKTASAYSETAIQKNTARFLAFDWKYTLIAVIAVVLCASAAMFYLHGTVQLNVDEIKEYEEKNLHMIYPEDSNILIYKGESNDYFRQYESVNSGK